MYVLKFSSLKVTLNIKNKLLSQYEYFVDLRPKKGILSCQMLVDASNK